MAKRKLVADRCIYECLCRRCANALWDDECECVASWRVCMVPPSREFLPDDPEWCPDFEEDPE